MENEPLYHPLEWLRESPEGIDPETVGYPGELPESTAHLIAMFQESGRNIFHIEPELVRLFLKTSVDEVISEDLKFPYDTFYLHFGEEAEIYAPVENEDPEPIHIPIEGAYISFSADWRVEFDAGELSINLVPGFVAGCSEENLTYEMNLTLHGNELGFIRDNARYAIAKRFLMKFENPWVEPNAFMLRNTGLTSSDIEKHRKEWRIPERDIQWKEPAYKALTLIINALTFITSEHSDVVEERPSSAPKKLLAKSKSAKPKEARRASNKLDSLGFTRVKILGRSFKGNVGVKRNGTGESQQSHWRRGHWRRQPFGPKKDSRTKLVWIKPTVVNPGNQPTTTEIRGHVYTAERDRK
jgi:hypothetical protein